MRAIGFCAALFACSTRTEIIVELDTDIADLHHYAVGIQGRSDETIEELPRAIDGELPSFGVAPLGGEIERTVTLEISGRNADDVELQKTARAISGFVKNQRERVHICLSENSSGDRAIRPGDPDETCTPSKDAGVDGGIDASIDAGDDGGLDGGIDGGDDGGTDAGDTGEDSGQPDDGGPQNLSVLHITGTGADVVGDLAVDLSGARILVGSFEQSISVSSTVTLFGGASDAFVVKYAPSGGVAWARRIHGTGTSITEAVATTTNSDGDVYVGGSFQDELRIDSVLIATGAAAARGFVLRFDADGALLEHLEIQSTSPARVYDVVLGNNEVYIGGVYQGPGVAAPTCPLQEFDVNGPSDRDGFVLSTADDFQCNWVQTIAGSGNDEIEGLAWAGGRVYAAGTFELSVAMPGSMVMVSDISSNARSAMFAAILDAGAPFSLLALGHIEVGDEGLAIAATDTDVYLGGRFASGALSGRYIDSLTMQSMDLNVAPDRLLLLRADVDLLPAANLATSDATTVTMRRMIPSGNAVLSAGDLTGTLTLDQSLAPVGRGGLLLDSWPAALATSLLIDGPGTESLGGVAIDASGRTIVAGNFSGTLVVGGVSLTATGSSDIFIYSFQ